MRRLIFLPAVCGLLAWCAADPGLRTERVFGPEVKTGPYKHPAAIEELANGDLYLAYYGGEGEYAVTTAVWGARYRAADRRWSAPEPVARDPLRSVGNPVLWQAPDGGPLWLFYVVRHGETWSTSRIQGKISRDQAKTWSDSFVVSDEPGMMVRGRPLAVGSGGDFLLPVYRETGHDTERVGPDSVSLVLRYDARRRAFTPGEPIRSPNGNIQPAIAEATPGRLLVAYCRRGGGYGPEEKGYIVRAESSDGGRTWSPGRDTEFPNPNAAVDLLRLASGKLLLVYNDSMNRRTPLTLALSSDGGRTWPAKRNLAAGPNDYAYPYAIQGRDGRIHVVYTSHGRTVVNHAVFDESWVAAAGR